MATAVPTPTVSTCPVNDEVRANASCSISLPVRMRNATRVIWNKDGAPTSGFLEVAGSGCRDGCRRLGIFVVTLRLVRLRAPLSTTRAHLATVLVLFREYLQRVKLVRDCRAHLSVLTVR